MSVLNQDQSTRNKKYQRSHLENMLTLIKYVLLHKFETVKDKIALHYLHKTVWFVNLSKLLLQDRYWEHICFSHTKFQ